MKRHLHVISRVTAAVVLGLACMASAHADPSRWAPGQLLVVERAGVPAAEFERALGQHGGRARRLGQSMIHVVTLPAGVPETAVAQILARNPIFKSVELDQRVPPALTANDPYASGQWHLPAIRANAAWDAARGQSIKIAVLDSGIHAAHPDLAANVLPGYNFFDRNAELTDVTGHGTAVAGTAAAGLNNNTGVAGIAGAAQILALRVSDTTGWAYFSTVAEAVTYAAENGARVVNCSYGNMFKSSAVQSAAAYLRSKGGLMVVSAGNNGVDEGAAAGDSIIVVSATTASDQLAGWSSHGAAVTVAAPGVNILTTNREGAYSTWNGTSFAAPAVAGVVALIMSANAALSPSQVQNILTSTAVDLGAAGRDAYFGWGRVDAQAAVAAALATVGADTQRPSVAIAAPMGGASVSGTVAVDVSASDNVGVQRVELRANGALVATDTAAPYQFSWNTAAFANGGVTLTAVAYDAAGNSQVSAPAAVSVANAAAPDTTPPTVRFSTPADGALVSGSVKIVVAADDNAGAAALRQSLFIDGVRVATGTGGALSYSWNARRAVMGPHTISAEAVDAAGNKTTTVIKASRVK